MRSNDQLGWTFVTEAEAIGTRAGIRQGIRSHHHSQRLFRRSRRRGDRRQESPLWSITSTKKPAPSPPKSPTPAQATVDTHGQHHLRLHRNRSAYRRPQHPRRQSHHHRQPPPKPRPSRHRAKALRRSAKHTSPRHRGKLATITNTHGRHARRQRKAARQALADALQQACRRRRQTGLAAASTLIATSPTTASTASPPPRPTGARPRHQRCSPKPHAAGRPPPSAPSPPGLIQRQRQSAGRRTGQHAGKTVNRANADISTGNQLSKRCPWPASSPEPLQSRHRHSWKAQQQRACRRNTARPPWH